FAHSELRQHTAAGCNDLRVLCAGLCLHPTPFRHGQSHPGPALQRRKFLLWPLSFFAILSQALAPRTYRGAFSFGRTAATTAPFGDEASLASKTPRPPRPARMTGRLFDSWALPPRDAGLCEPCSGLPATPPKSGRFLRRT